MFPYQPVTIYKQCPLKKIPDIMILTHFYFQNLSMGFYLLADKMKCIHYLYWIYTVRSELETHCLFDKGLMKSDIMSDCISCAKLMFKNVKKFCKMILFLVTQSITFISFSKECFNFF